MAKKDRLVGRNQVMEGPENPIHTLGGLRQPALHNTTAVLQNPKDSKIQSSLDNPFRTPSVLGLPLVLE